MSRMKTFFIYLLLFVGLYVVSNLLIDAYIKTSYYKIETYDIDVKEANITRDFVGRGYVKVTKGENTTISYADINVESSARSLKTVAAEIQGTDFYNNQLTDYQRSLVDTWAAK